ncbi:MAG: 1,4-dihydroxy-2-naphthoate polyprenyltransferase [Streptosporangiaceae bacterium]
MARVADWLEGARPRTLPAAVVPVAVGTAVAWAQDAVVWWRAVAALVVSLALQVGVNYANDYSDGVRGADSGRVGPTRLVASGLVRPRVVLAAAFACFAAAAGLGLTLAAVTSWWLVALGVCCIAAAWFYTGGENPYGYRALGELSVFVFFGVVAVVGTAYVQVGHVTGLALAASVPVGLLACALLVVNNLRDIPSDTRAGKRTLAVVLGERRTRLLYAACVAVPFAAVCALAPAHPYVLVALPALLVAVSPLRAVLTGGDGRTLILALRDTGRLHLAFGALLTLGIAL